MRTTEFTVHTSLSPAEVMTLFTDFGPERVNRWPNLTEGKYEVHDQGEGWAEVTEGNARGWERERYSWDLTAGTVTVDTLESNLWAPESSWHYTLAPAAEGTDVRVTLTRVPKSFRGRLIGALIPLVGARTLGRQLESVLRNAESR